MKKKKESAAKLHLVVAHSDSDVFEQYLRMFEFCLPDYSYDVHWLHVGSRACADPASDDPYTSLAMQRAIEHTFNDGFLISDDPLFAKHTKAPIYVFAEATSCELVCGPGADLPGLYGNKHGFVEHPEKTILGLLGNIKNKLGRRARIVSAVAACRYNNDTLSNNGAAMMLCTKREMNGYIESVKKIPHSIKHDWWESLFVPNYDPRSTIQKHLARSKWARENLHCPRQDAILAIFDDLKASGSIECARISL